MSSEPVRQQIQLSWRQSYGMALRGMRVQLRRSLLTTLSVICAMAFLGYVWTSADLLASFRIAAENDPLLERQLMINSQMQIGASEIQRTNLLVVLSLIVVTVGISNAMAMSVTERFGQIGTMKCLGALNSFIARLFILEAVFLGLAGTCIGGLCGTVLSAAQMALQYGWSTAEHFPLAPVLVKAAATVALGLAISLVAAVYPAILAARMEPVEAMRVTM